MKNQGCAHPHLWRQNPPHIEKTRGFIPILMNINKCVYKCIYIYIYIHIFVLNWGLTISWFVKTWKEVPDAVFIPGRPAPSASSSPQTLKDMIEDLQWDLGSKDLKSNSAHVTAASSYAFEYLQFCNERSISSDFFVWMSRSLGIEQILSSQAAQGLHSNHDKPSSQQVRKDFQVFDKSLSKLKRGLIYIITSGLSNLRVSLMGHVVVPVPDKHHFSCWGSGRNAHE